MITEISVTILIVFFGISVVVIQLKRLGEKRNSGNQKNHCCMAAIIISYSPDAGIPTKFYGPSTREKMF